MLDLRAHLAKPAIAGALPGRQSASGHGFFFHRPQHTRRFGRTLRSHTNCAVRNFTARFLFLRELHEGGALGLPARAHQLALFHLRYICGRLHRALLLAGVRRDPRQQITPRPMQQGSAIDMPLSPFALCIIMIVGLSALGLPIGHAIIVSSILYLTTSVPPPRNPQRIVQQLCPSRDPVIHTRRRPDEHRQPYRSTAAVLSGSDRPLSRRTRARQRRSQYDLCWNVRFGNRRQFHLRSRWGSMR